jgi:two-component system response regulator HupR/HoxA
VLLAAAPRRLPGQSRFSPDGGTLKDQVESLEKHIVAEALSRHRWNRCQAADELGLSRVGLANKIRRYGLDRAS